MAGTARRSPNRNLPGTVGFRESESRGLLVNVWVNGVGPFNFAVDTGAGATLLSTHVAQAARVLVKTGRPTRITGMSGTGSASGREATLRSLALGGEDNLLPGKGLVMVAEGLPAGVDGILDPTESYWPLGYTIDFPNGEISAFDPRTNPLRAHLEPNGGTIIPWLFDRESRRPFVRLSSGHKALIDTGSRFGLALSENAARSFGIETGHARERSGSAVDLGGGRFSSRRVRPVSVQVGSLALNRIPTDVLTGVEAGAPILLGREALHPFQISFDPQHRLIRITPARED
jgi:predicted aspartyl protease